MNSAQTESPPAPAPPDPLGPAFTAHRDALRKIADRGLAADLAGKVGASDIVQDTFFAAVRDRDQFRGESPREFRGWLEGILRNRLLTVRRHFRASARRQVSREVALGAAATGGEGGWYGEVAAPTTASPLSRVAREERSVAIREALARLGEADRRLIRWHVQDRMTFAVIADRLGIAEDAARKRWARALIRLRDAVGPAHGPG